MQALVQQQDAHVFQLVFSYLDLTNLCTCESVCKFWSKSCKVNFLSLYMNLYGEKILPLYETNHVQQYCAKYKLPAKKNATASKKLQQGLLNSCVDRFSIPCPRNPKRACQLQFRKKKWNMHFILPIFEHAVRGGSEHNLYIAYYFQNSCKLLELSSGKVIWDMDHDCTVVRVNLVHRYDLQQSMQKIGAIYTLLVLCSDLTMFEYTLVDGMKHVAIQYVKKRCLGDYCAKWNFGDFYVAEVIGQVCNNKFYTAVTWSSRSVMLFEQDELVWHYNVASEKFHEQPDELVPVANDCLIIYRVFAYEDCDSQMHVILFSSWDRERRLIHIRAKDMYHTALMRQSFGYNDQNPDNYSRSNVINYLQFAECARTVLSYTIMDEPMFRYAPHSMMLCNSNLVSDNHIYAIGMYKDSKSQYLLVDKDITVQLELQEEYVPVVAGEWFVLYTNGWCTC